jgi:hypothetical protein
MRVWDWCGWARVIVAAWCMSLCTGSGGTAAAANHLDTPTVVADPRADIGDLFAWIAPDGKRLNLVMTIVGHTFSNELSYSFHVDSGRRFGKTTQTIAISCRFSAPNAADCAAGDADRAIGDASVVSGLRSRGGRFVVFAGLRDDPFFNNVKGPRNAYKVFKAALDQGVERDAAKCPRLSSETSQAISNEMSHTDGGPGQNFLAGWTPSALVVSIDLDVVTQGGPMLAVWSVTSTPNKQLDRMGRPLTENALLGTLGPAEVANALKEKFNATTPANAAEFIAPIEGGLQLYDAFDNVCGNQLLTSKSPGSRYRRLAELLADDRLWVNSKSAVCEQFFAVELAHLAGRSDLKKECGGRTVTADAVDVYRSLLVNGTTMGMRDGVDRDEREHSTAVFPFLAAPENVAATAAGANK